MKKIIALLLSALLLLAISACGGDAADPPTPSLTPAATPVLTPEPSPMPEWKDLTAQYETWVDAYIDTYTAALANPTDNALYDKLEEMTGEASQWDRKLSKQEMALVNQPDLQEYIDEVLRITQKLNDFAETKNT